MGGDGGREYWDYVAIGKGEEVTGSLGTAGRSDAEGLPVVGHGAELFGQGDAGVHSVVQNI